MDWSEARDWMRANPGELMEAANCNCVWRYSEAGRGFQLLLDGSWVASYDFSGSGPSLGCDDRIYQPYTAAEWGAA